MHKYTFEECAALLGFFPHNYTTVLHHGRFPNITFQETQMLSKKTRLLGEFLAVSGLAEIDFSSCPDIIAFVDDYLDTGLFQKERFSELSQRLETLRKPLEEIISSYKNAGKINEDGTGGHIVLFVPTYAYNLLTTCHMVEIMFEGPDKLEVRQRLKQARRNDPDADPQHEFA